MGAHPSQLSKHVNPGKDRVVLDFTPRACCGKATGFTPRDRKNVPPQLLAHGVTPSDWQRWIQSYDEMVTPKSNCCVYIFLIICAWILFIPGLIIWMCCSYFKCSPFQQAVFQWLEHINQRELRHRNMYAKFQTLIIQYGRSRSETTTLSIALNENEAERLMSEPNVVQPDCGECTSCETMQCCKWEADRIV